jgi:hypothetical protein
VARDEFDERFERLAAALMVDARLRLEFLRRPHDAYVRFGLEHVDVPQRPGKALQPLDQRESPSPIGGVILAALAEGMSANEAIKRGKLPPAATLALRRAEAEAQRRTLGAAAAQTEPDEPGETPRRNPVDEVEPPPLHRRTDAVPFEREIEAAARKHDLRPELLKGLIKQESGFDPTIVSKAGAVGLCQLMPGTARDLGVTDRTDPEQSINGGARYLRQMLDRYDGDERLALAAYNAGPGRVTDHVPEIPETQDYVKRVLANAKVFEPDDTESPDEEARRDNSAEGLRETGRLLLGDALNGHDRPEHPVGSGGDDRPKSHTVEAFKAEAERIDDAEVPYLWGGGHGARQLYGSQVTPLDCSGAVSRVLGLDPRVSGAFMAWGDPGEGERVTIYANERHVLMEIDGHFFGTSTTNPGGGAGWIKRGDVSDAYLAQFTARHPLGL